MDGGITNIDMKIHEAEAMISGYGDNLLNDVVNREIQVEVLKLLGDIESRHSVRILWAVETGSRAWGFSSPDSDYDVRFIYVHRPEWYLSIKEGRDVIELPIEDDLDINGWELRKSLRLFRKSNPTFLEWIVSPYVYLHFGSFVEQARELAERYYNPKAVAYHYTRMAEKNFRVYIFRKQQVILKKYLYVIRPLINVIWLMENDGLIPLSLRQTMKEVTLSLPARDAIVRLIRRKSSSPELGLGRRIPAIDVFIKEVLSKAQIFCQVAPPKRVPLKEIDRVFRETIRGAWR